MTKEKITLRDETVEKLVEIGGRREVDNVQQVISKYLEVPEKLIKRVILFFVETPVMICQEMGLRLESGFDESKEEAQIFLDELVFQYKKIHPQFNYGYCYTVETDAEKQLFEELEENPYAYDIIMERLERNKNCGKDEVEEILRYLNSKWSIRNKKGFKKLGFESCTASSIRKVANSTATVFMEMTSKEEK